MTHQDFKGILWANADTLRNSMDDAEYKHVVFGLLFLTYLSDSFEIQCETLKQQFKKTTTFKQTYKHNWQKWE